MSLRFLSDGIFFSNELCKNEKLHVRHKEKKKFFLQITHIAQKS